MKIKITATKDVTSSRYLKSLIREIRDCLIDKFCIEVDVEYDEEHHRIYISDDAILTNKDFKSLTGDLHQDAFDIAEKYSKHQ